MKKIVVCVLLAVFVLSACASAPSTPQTNAEPASGEAPAGDALFQIVKADGSTFDVTLDAVKALPLAQLVAEGKVEEGPYLSDVLELAGVTEFAEVTLSGSSNPATLTYDQVDENTILDFNNHGTMKLASTYIPKANWTKDVAQITVK